MNDIDEIRATLAEADPCPPGSLAGAARDPIGRAAYARVTATSPVAPHAASRAGSRAGRPRRTALRFATAGGLAVALAAGVTVAQNLGDGGGHPLVPGLRAPAANAQEALTRAADSAAAKPFTPPRPDQWIYTEFRYRRAGVPAKGQVFGPGTPLKTTIDRSWLNYTGDKVALFDQGKLVTSATGGGTPPTDYPTVSRLPRDADGMLAWARGVRGPVADRQAGTYQVLSSLLLNNSVLPPAQTAAVYRALAKIPGVRLDRTATDAQGRPVLSVAYTIEGWVTDETLLDPSTYAYRGHRATVVRDHTFEDGGTFKKGLVESISLRVAVRVVDRPGA